MPVCQYNYFRKSLLATEFPFLFVHFDGCLVSKKWLKVKQSTGFNTIQAFATLLILCYVSVFEACIELIYLIESSIPLLVLNM